MTDFDAKLAELENNSDRVPELKLVVELMRMLGQQAGISDKSMPIPTSVPIWPSASASLDAAEEFEIKDCCFGPLPQSLRRNMP